MPPLEGKNGYSTKLSGASPGGRTGTGTCSNSPLGFTGLPAVTRAAHVRGTGGIVRCPRCICTMLTIKELSAWLNIKPSTLYLWVSQNKIPCCRIHGLIRFEPDAIQGWLNTFSGPRINPPRLTRHDARDVDHLIAAAKTALYTPRCEKPDQDRAKQGGR